MGVNLDVDGPERAWNHRGVAALGELETHCLTIETDGAVARVVLDAPPVNVMTWRMVRELSQVAAAAEADPDIRVLVFTSAHPEFWLAHFDVAAIARIPVDTPAVRPSAVHPFHAMCLAYRALRKPTLAMIDGRVGGGGAEFAAALAMRFGSLERAVVTQMEVPLGILPGGGGTQLLPRLVGRARALELILGGGELDARTAETWGWLNRALPAADLAAFVDELAARLATFDPGAVARAMEAVDAANGPLVDGLLTESFLFDECLRLPNTPGTLARFLALGGQTAEGERRVAELAVRSAASATTPD